ncbi:putative protein kinase [Medicago truncatula]|nr:putative protein kinase [Medicago truncatula]
MTTSANKNVIAIKGTLGYNAPEILTTKKPTTTTHIYSFCYPFGDFNW